MEKLGVSERQACRALGQHRSTQRYERKQPQKDCELIDQIRQQVKRKKHRRYGYRRITEILRRLGWWVNHKRIYRLWSTHDFKLPRKRKGKKRFNGNGHNACDQKPPAYVDHIWSYDFVEEKLDNGRKVRILNIIDPKYSDMEIRALQKPCFRAKFCAEKLFWCFHPLDIA